MTTISVEQDVVTLINVFTVKSEDQQRLVDVLVEEAAIMRRNHGYVSSNVHRSLDGATVVNYIQWRSREDFETMLANPGAAGSHMQEIARIAEKVERHLYEVSFVDQVQDDASRSG